MSGVRDLFFRISARAEGLSAFKAAGGDLRRLEGVADAIRARASTFGRSARNIGALLTATVTAPLIAAARASIGAQGEQEKAEAQVAQAVRQTGGAAGLSTEALFSAAKALQKLTNEGDATILRDVTAQLLTFGNIGAGVFLRAQEAALDLNAVLGGDLKAQTIRLAKALNDPLRGVAALGEAGVQFSAAQGDVIKALARSGRVAEAQGLILDEIAKFYGGQAASAAATLDGQIAGLAADWRDLMESFGATAGAQLAPFIAGLRDVIAALAQAPKGVRVFIVAAGALAAAIGPVVAVVGLFALALGAVAAPVAAVVAGLALGAAVLVALWPDIEAGAAQLRDALGRAASAVSDGAARGVAAMRRLVAEVLSVIRAGFDRAIASAQRVAAQVADAFERLYVRVVGNSSVPDMVDGVLDRMGEMKANGVRSAGEAASVIEASVQSLGEAVAGQFASAARGGGFDVRQIAGAFVGAIVTGAASSLSNAAIGALSPQGVTQAAPAPDFSFGASTFPATDIPARGAPFTQPGAAQPVRLDVTASVNVTVNTESPAAFMASAPMIQREIASAVRRARALH